MVMELIIQATAKDNEEVGQLETSVQRDGQGKLGSKVGGKLETDNMV